MYSLIYMKILESLFCFFLLSNILYSQELTGYVYDRSNPVAFAHIIIDYNGESKGVSTDLNGFFKIKDLRIGEVSITVSKLGRKTKQFSYVIKEGINKIDCLIEEEIYNLDQIVITGTKTFKRQTQSPVIVNIINNTKIESVQACNISEALNFQGGVRVETDCQTCNYTQLRINGLAGGYSQILINGKAIFSPLAGLYGMEQIPSNMIERIEVIRGGGSALYGSSAIGGVVNLITTFPRSNDFDCGYSFRSISHNVNDKLLFGNLKSGGVIKVDLEKGKLKFLEEKNKVKV